jgi:hypothetical protein
MTGKIVGLRQPKSFYLAFILGTMGGFAIVIGLWLAFSARSASNNNTIEQKVSHNYFSKPQESTQNSFHRDYPPASLTYNVTQLPPFQSNANLQQVVDNAVNLVRAKNLPLHALSISLIKLNSDRCCEYAGYQDQQPR